MELLFETTLRRSQVKNHKSQVMSEACDSQHETVPNSKNPTSVLVGNLFLFFKELVIIYLGALWLESYPVSSLKPWPILYCIKIERTI